MIKSFSQTTELEVLESVEFPDKEKTKDIVAMHSSSKNERGIVRISKDYMVFDVFEENLKPISRRVVELGKKENHLATLYFENEIKIFTLASAKRKIREVNCYTFDLNNKNYVKTLLFKKELEKNQRLFSNRNKRQTSFAKSPNGNYFAMLTDNVNKNTNAYTVQMYNAITLQEIFKKDYQKDTEKHFKINDVTLDNEGAIYVVGKLYLEGKKDKKDKKDKNANYNFILNKITQNNVQVSKINLEAEFISTLSFAEIKEQVKLFGFYSDKNSYKIKGVCSFVFNMTDLTLLKKRQNKLPVNIYEDLYGVEAAVKKSNKELNNFYLDHILEDSKENVYLVLEEFYVTSSYVPTGINGGGYTTYTYHFDDVLILKFDKDGAFSWGKSVYKKSQTPSYNAFLMDDKLHLVLNSGKRIKEKDDGRKKVSKGWFESSSLYDITFNKDGVISYNKIQDNKGKNYYLPAYGVFTKDEAFIMLSANTSNIGKTPKRKLMLLR